MPTLKKDSAPSSYFMCVKNQPLSTGAAGVRGAPGVTLGRGVGGCRYTSFGNWALRYDRKKELPQRVE